MNTSARKKILIVDDHPLVNHGLAEIIEQEDNLTVCGRATSVAEATEMFADEHPDLVVLDILLPDGSGWDLLESFTRDGVSAEVLVFSSLDPELYAGKARSMGAAGYVHKSMAITEIVPAIHCALREAPA